MNDVITGSALSKREQDVCDYVVMGWGSKEIARQLGISKRTVETHREMIYRKMGVRNVVELVRKVLISRDHPYRYE